MTYWQHTQDTSLADSDYAIVIEVGGDHFRAVYNNDIPLPNIIRVDDLIIECWLTDAHPPETSP